MKEKSTASPAFDEIDRPSLDIIRDCVHCGFCLTACPTYLETGSELDSPRGRIYLMKSAIEGRIPMGEALVKHLDLCLGCLACEPACPSGVRYGSLIESARSQIERRYKRPFSERFYRSLLFSVFPYPKRLRFLLPFLFLYQVAGVKRLVQSSGVLRRLSEKLAHTEEMLPEVELSSLFSALPNVTPAKGKKRFRVAFLSGCVQSVLFPETNAATVRVLSQNGCEVVIPRNQVCCGALSLHSGRLSEARDFARSNIPVFENSNVDAIIVNSAGCGSAMKEYGELLKNDSGSGVSPISPTGSGTGIKRDGSDEQELSADINQESHGKCQPVALNHRNCGSQGTTYYAERGEKLSKKIKDVMEFLADIGLQGELKELKLRVTYQDACHIVHAQRIKTHSRKIIKQIPGIEFIELPESDICCGSAGIYNLVEPEMAERLLERKVSKLKETGAQVLVAGNPGCLLQIGMGIKRYGLNIKIVHPVELLDWAYRGKVKFR